VNFAGSAGAGSGGNFAYAQSAGQVTSTQAVEFLTYRFQNIRDFSISTEAMLSSGDNRGAFEEIVTLESDNCLRNLSNTQEIFMFGAGGGASGSFGTGVMSQVGSIVGDTIVLVNASDGVKFEDGMELDAAAAVSSGGLLAYGTNGLGLYIVQVDRQNGILTTGVSQAQGATPCAPTDAANGIPSLAQGSYLFMRTFRNNVMQGIEQWIPFGGPSSTLFNGVNRTLDPVRLAGQSLDCSQKSISDTVIDLTTAVRLQGQKLSHMIVPFSWLAKAQKDGMARDIVVQETEYDIAFSGIRVMGVDGPVTILGARNCPSNRLYGIDISSWEYTYVGKDAVFMWDLDGSGGLRQPSDDGIEYRYMSFGNLVCHRPDANITAKI
jgi:hypothetical protein